MISKFVARDAPYIEETFGSLIDGLYGSSRMLAGGTVTVVTSTTVSVSPYIFMQAGLVVVNPDGHGTVVVPNFSTEKRPIFLIVSSPDITLASGVVITATPALYAATGVILAVRTNDVWVSSPSSSVTASDDAIRLVEKNLGTGVISGLDPRIIKSGTDGTTGVAVRVGQALDAQGVKNLTAGTAAGTAADEHVDLSNGPQDAYWPKSNYYVLRTPLGVIRAGGPSITYTPLDLPTRAGVTVDTTVVAAAVVVRPSDGLAGVVYTKGTTLKYTTYSPSDSQVLAPVTVFTSTGTFDGARDLCAAIRSDGSLVISFSDSSGSQRILKIVSINFDTGVAVPGDGGVKTISSQPNQVRAGRFVLDQTDTMHAVAQHNEAAPNNQVYYFRVNAAAGANFGTLLSGTPRIVGGANDGGNDTNPTVAIDSLRNLTVAYAKGTGSNVFGNIVVVLLDPSGNTLSTTVVSTSSITAAGGIATPYDTPTTLAEAAYPRAVVTPQGTSYILFAASTGANLHNLYLYSPTFTGRFGKSCIDLFRTNAADISFLELYTDDLGVLRAVSNVTTAAATAQVFRLDTVVAPQNVLAPSVLDDFAGVAGNQFSVALSPSGSNRVVTYDTGTGTLLTATVSGGFNGFFTPHPNDSFLGAWSLMPTSGLPQSVATVNPQRYRPARFSNPIQVGRDGDFIGFESLISAINVALGSGLIVRLMPGLHHMYGSQLDFYYGSLELEGCPGAVVAVDVDDVPGMNFGGRGPLTISANPAPGVFDVSGVAPMFPGDVLLFQPGIFDPAYASIVQVESGSRVRVYPDATASTPVSGAVYSSVRMSGIRFIGTFGSAQLGVISAWSPLIKDCFFENIQLNVLGCEGGMVQGNRFNGQSLVAINCNRTAFVGNESMNKPVTSGAGGFSFQTSHRLRVAHNRSMDHGSGTFGYHVDTMTDFSNWSDNLGTVNADDPGRMISNNQVITAAEVIATDIRVERLNGGAYDAKIAALAGEIDALKPQPVIAGNYLRTFTFSDNSALFF